MLILFQKIKKRLYGSKSILYYENKKPKQPKTLKQPKTPRKPTRVGKYFLSANKHLLTS